MLLDGLGVLERQAVGLRLHAHFVDEDAGVGGAAGEGEDATFVDEQDFTDGSWILEPRSMRW